jgi:hypothetical protein
MLFLLTWLITQSSAAGFQVGVETHVSRDVVKPNLFPIAKAAIDGSSAHTEYDLQFRISPNHPQANALTSQNFYYRIQEKDSPFQVSIGRKFIVWNEADEIWNTGIINPTDSWDRLRPSSQGLTGLFISTESESARFDFFGSYLMIPEAMPNVVIENHQFRFDHPQSVSSGPQTFELLNRDTPMGYNLKLPSLSSLLLRPSILASLESKKSLAPVRIRVAAGYLPLNYFPVALQASLAIPLDQIVVDLRPRALSHLVFSGDVSWAINDESTLGISAIRDEIKTESSLPDDYTTARLGATNYFSPWFKYGPVRLAQLWSFGGIGADIGPYASSNQNLFSSRILYRNATQLAIRWQELSARLTHEYSIQANWIALDWNKQWSQSWSTVIGGDVVSAEQLTAADRGAEFLADLRAIDRIRLGVTYAF